MPVDPNDFNGGFEQGYRAVKGAMVILPHAPVPPVPRIGYTAFQTGVMKGIERALGQTIKTR